MGGDRSGPALHHRQLSGGGSGAWCTRDELRTQLDRRDGYGGQEVYMPRRIRPELLLDGLSWIRGVHILISFWLVKDGSSWMVFDGETELWAVFPKVDRYKQFMIVVIR